VELEFWYLPLDKPADHSARGIMNIFNLSNTKTQNCEKTGAVNKGPLRIYLVTSFFVRFLYQYAGRWPEKGPKHAACVSRHNSILSKPVLCSME